MKLPVFCPHPSRVSLPAVPSAEYQDNNSPETLSPVYSPGRMHIMILTQEKKPLFPPIIDGCRDHCIIIEQNY